MKSSVFAAYFSHFKGAPFEITFPLTHYFFRGQSVCTQVAALLSRHANLICRVASCQPLPKRLGILPPSFRQLPLEEKSVRSWSEDSTPSLQTCFNCTDWQACSDNINDLCETVSSYITFCGYCHPK